eukprot:g3819.t1
MVEQATFHHTSIGVTSAVILDVARDPRVGRPLMDVAESREDGSPLFTQQDLERMPVKRLKQLGLKHGVGPPVHSTAADHPGASRLKTNRSIRSLLRVSLGAPAEAAPAPAEESTTPATRLRKMRKALDRDSSFKVYGAKEGMPRGRDNFDWEAEDADPESAATWVRALRQPLVSTAQVCEYIVLRDTG